MTEHERGIADHEDLNRKWPDLQAQLEELTPEQQARVLEDTESFISFQEELIRNIKEGRMGEEAVQWSEEALKNYEEGLKRREDN